MLPQGVHVESMFPKLPLLFLIAELSCTGQAL